MTQVEAFQILAILKAAFPNSYNGLSEDEALGVANVWALHFAEMPADIVHMALQKAISVCKFPPSISEVKDKMGSLYYEACGMLEEYDWENLKRFELTESEKASYLRIKDMTEKYRTGNLEGPRIETMIGDCSSFVALEAGKDAEIVSIEG